jgi:hypothetical protein
METKKNVQFRNQVLRLVRPATRTLEKSSGRHCWTVRLFTRCSTSPRCKDVAAWDNGTVPRTFRDCIAQPQ